MPPMLPAGYVLPTEETCDEFPVGSYNSSNVPCQPHVRPRCAAGYDGHIRYECIGSDGALIALSGCSPCPVRALCPFVPVVLVTF